MSLRIDYEPGLTDRELHNAAIAAEDELYMCGGHPLECDCYDCLPELYDPAEIEAGRGEKGRAA